MNGRYRLRLENLGVISVAVHAFVGCVLVNDDRLLSHKLGLHVALATGHVGVAAREGEMRAGVMVECGRHPALGVVAIAAVRLGVFGDELAVMNIIVASLALLWSALES